MFKLQKDRTREGPTFRDRCGGQSLKSFVSTLSNATEAQQAMEKTIAVEATISPFVHGFSVVVST